MSILEVATSSTSMAPASGMISLNKEPARGDIEVPAATLTQYTPPDDDRQQSILVVASAHMVALQDRKKLQATVEMLMDSKQGSMEQRVVEVQISKTRGENSSPDAVSRIPLQDCTNWILRKGEADSSGTKTTHKGQ